MRKDSDNKKRFTMNVDNVRQRTKSGGGIPYIKSGYEMFKPKDSRNKVRILPPTWDNPEHYGVDLKVHNNVGSNSMSYLCLQGMHGEDCPICEEVEMAKREGDDDYAKKIGVKFRTFVWLIDRSDEGNNPKLWSMPNKWPADLDNQFLSLATDEDSGNVLQYHDLDDGYDLLFTYATPKGKTPGQFSTPEISRRSTPVDDDEVVKVTEDNPLPDLLEYKSYDSLKALFNGKVDEDDEDDEEEEEEDTNNDNGSDKNEEEVVPRKQINGVKKQKVRDWTSDDLEEMSKPQLKDIAEELGFENVADMKRSKLQDEIADALGFGEASNKESKRQKRSVVKEEEEDIEEEEEEEDIEEEEEGDDDAVDEVKSSKKNKMRERLKSLRNKRK